MKPNDAAWIAGTIILAVAVSDLNLVHRLVACFGILIMCFAMHLNGKESKKDPPNA